MNDEQTKAVFLQSEKRAEGLILTLDLGGGARRYLQRWGDGKLEPLDEAPDQADLLSRLQSAERDRDEARAGERNLSEHARRVAAEATAAFEVVEDVDAAWEAIGLPGNRGRLTLAEQVASICRERDDALADRDALKAERDDEGVLQEALDRALGDCGALVPKVSPGIVNMLGRHMVHHIADIRRERAAAPQPTGGDHGE